ncbi:helix-turn-helix transcriptional regulator [Gordonia desulfuricans]|uniref:Helix-turn-helix transcriptional regulator n=1 Tax=Gordonia desulfuricans TaxID=89051 RepID=A0A7K3LTX4_9ACTN|nr:TetR/AcrR family transcriptional regulator [Gordonia desulfuricans]NDK91689.1 helix-turn-helix transcriptional regulator [Gordonia desulfuricans]
MGEEGPARGTRRRGQTRRRLLDASFEVFAELGYGSASVEKIVERAGFTRGAFYSNFGSLEELFLAMWEDRSAAMIGAIGTALEQAAVSEPVGVDDVVEQILAMVPIDARWFGISAEFTAHALRDPALRTVIAQREAAIADALLPMVVELLGYLGRVIPDPDAFVQAIIAVHDGTMMQVLLDDDLGPALRRRADLFRHVVLAYSDVAERGSPAAMRETDRK